MTCARSILHTPANLTSAALSTTVFLIDADSGDRLTYSIFLQHATSLSSSPHFTHLQKRRRFRPLPVLYFSLLSLSVAISPSNPLASTHELAQQIQLS